MRKYLLLSLLIVWSIPCFAAETIRLRTDIDLHIDGVTGGTVIPLNSQAPSGDATAEAAPGKVYLPIQNNGAANTTTNEASNLFFISTTPSVFNVTSTADVARIPVRVNTPVDAARYMYAAVKDTTTTPNTFKVIKKYTDAAIPLGQQNDLIFSLAAADICNGLPTLCTSLIPTSPTKAETSFTVYFFLSIATNYGPSDTIDPTTAPLNNGIYFQVFMSNRTYSSADLTITISNVRVGDKRLVLEYNSTGTITAATAKSVRVFKHTAPAIVDNKPIASYTGALTITEYPYLQNSEVTVSGLTNGDFAYLSVLFVDKYNFGTNLSKDSSGKPLEIQELLKKNSCFLLTAGFGEDHYVISYFRHFRDTVLANSFLGRKFIHFYYGTAPKYALMIYQHESIRAGIRGAAYVLYFIFNYVYAVTFVLLGACGLVVYRKRLKIKQSL